MTLTVYVTRDYVHMSDVAADIFLEELRALTITRGRSVNLTLPTGNSPKGLYERAIQRQNEFDATKISVRNVDELILEPHLHASKSYSVILENMLGEFKPNFREAATLVEYK